MEGTKPMMGHERLVKVASQRTLIAKRFNLAITRGVNPDGYAEDNNPRSANLIMMQSGDIG